MTATEKLTNVESENKANRETIQRLVHDLDKLEKDSINNKLVFDNMKAVSLNRSIVSQLFHIY